MSGTAVGANVERGIARLVLDHPPLNILTRRVLADFRDQIEALAGHPTLRVAVLMAEGDSLAGADVGEHLPPHDAELIPEFMDTVAALDAFPLPFIAAVRGQCLGGAFELIQAADLVVAGESATFGQPEIKLGLIPPAACVLLPLRVPAGLAGQIVYSGDPISARDAERAGLVARVVPDAEVDTAALELAGRIARHSGAALRLAKRALRGPGAEARAAALRGAGDLYLGSVMATADALEGLGSFVEQRRPSWSHT